MRATRHSRVRRPWEPPAEAQPPWADLERDRPLFTRPEPAIAHLPADQIGRQLVELIHDEAGALEAQARRQVARQILGAIRPWLDSSAGRR